jgi:hypothetical protein
MPKLKMATPFLVLKTLTGFDFQFTKVSSHFCELVLVKRISELGANWEVITSYISGHALHSIIHLTA